MMQKEFFDQDLNLAESLRDHGINKALESANETHDDWSEKALQALIQFANEVNDEFMVEDVRNWASWVPEPPSKRAWGAVAVKAAKAGIIKKTGYGLTTNPKAHRTPATLWQRNKLAA